MRGQATLFIIVAGLLVIALGGYYTYQGGQLAPSTDPSSFISTCLADVTEDAVYLIAKSGGYISPAGAPEYGDAGDGKTNKEHFFFDDAMLPYVLDKDAVTLRPIPAMENVLARYIQKNSANCYDLSSFKEQGWQSVVDEKLPSVRVTIAPTEVTVESSKVVRLTKEGQEISVDKSIASVPMRLGLLHGLAGDLLNDMRAKASYTLSANCAKFSLGDELINIYKTVNQFYKEYAVRIVDADPLARGKRPLAFQFAIKNVQVEGQCVG